MTKGVGLAVMLVWGATCMGAEIDPVARMRNWHQWRGPLADGTAPQAEPPREWSETKNIKWKVPIPGKGSATPIVWEDRIFVLTAIPTGRQVETASAAAEAEEGSAEPPARRRGRFNISPPTEYYQFVILCLDRHTGRELWKRVAIEAVPHEGGHATNTFASGSPVTDGRFVYASFGSRGVYCYDLDGDLQWKRDLGQMQTRNAFGEANSPSLHGDALVVPWDHEGPSRLFVLDANTGETRWQVERDERTTWAAPLIVEHEGRTQVIANGSNRVRSYDLETGQLIWECGGQAANPIPSPVTDGVNVYCMTGYRGYAVYAIPLDAQGDVTETGKVAWSRTDAGPYVSSPVLYEGQLYFTKSRDAILLSLDAQNGETRIDQARLPAVRSFYASPVAAADRIYFTGREGATVVLKHGDQFEVLATNQLDEGIDASPALVGRQLFLRGEEHLYCIEEAGQ